MTISTLLIAALAASFLGQAANAGTSPAELFATASQSMGLNFSGARPWHIKASYTLFSPDDSHPISGVFEEWWMAPHKYKRSYTRDGFNQTDYGTDAGLYRVGELKWPAGHDAGAV